MSTPAWIALYIAQALFWLWLGRDAGRDAAKRDAHDQLGWVERPEALKFQMLLWVILVVSTVWFILGLLDPAARLGGHASGQ